jgi:hypothetical protein
MDQRFATNDPSGCLRPVFLWGYDYGQEVRIARPEGKLNDLRHLALFGAVAAANAENGGAHPRRHRGARQKCTRTIAGIMSIGTARTYGNELGSTAAIGAW